MNKKVKKKLEVKAGDKIMELAQFEKKLKDENLLKIYDRGSWKDSVQ